MRFLFTLLAGALALGMPLRAADEAKCDGKCPTAEKISRVLASWKSATEAAAKGCPDEAARVRTKLLEVARGCPIGSRMPETLGFVKAVLESSIAANAAAASTCPVAKAEAASREASAPNAACAEASKLCAARSQLLASLNELACHAVCATSAPACAAAKTVEATAGGLCASKAGEIVAKIRAETCDKNAAAIVLKSIEGLKCETKAGEIVASIRAEKCDEAASKILAKASEECCAAAKAVATSAAPAAATCTAKAGEGCAAGNTCCKDLAARATALKASWEKAPTELKDLCPQKRQEIQTALASIAPQSPAVQLLPETVGALAEGFEALVSVNTKMAEWAKANPEALKDVTCEAKKAFETQNALISEANEILRKVKCATSNMAPACAAEKKTETASAK